MAERVLVSGGSGGIGGALCRLLPARGFLPVIAYHRGHQRAEALAAETGGQVLHLDLADDAGIDAAVAVLAEGPEPLRAVVLAASPPPAIMPFGQVSPEEAARQWRVNVEGPRRLLAGLIKSCFRPRKRGAVIAILSAAMGEAEGKSAQAMGAYVIAKYGLKGVLAAAKGDFPWLETAIVSPGFTETAMLDCFDPRFLDMMRSQQPRGRFATPEEAATEIAAALTP